MSKRNFILLIIILVIVTLSVLGFLYLRRTTPAETGGGTNFGSIFNPFGPSTPAAPGTTTPPADVSGYQSEPTTTPGQVLKLQKISSVPVAGFTVFNKERLIEIPAPAENKPSVVYNFGIGSLKKGMTGEAVKELQKFLNNTLDLKLAVDGVFSEEIDAKVKMWQADHKLVTNGVVGPKTMAAMYASVDQETGAGKPTPPKTEFAPALRYVDRATGNIYQTFADKIQEKKFSGTVIPKVYEAFLVNNGESVIMRYLKDDGKTIETFVGSLPKELLGGDTTGNNEIKGSFLPENVKDISLSPDGTSMFYLFENGDNMIGTILNLVTNKKTQIFESAFTEWLSSFANNKITLTTKPSSLIPGYMYTLDLGTKNLSKSLGNINGLTTLISPNGKTALYADSGLFLSAYHTGTKNADSLGIKTLSDKCVWGKTSDVVYCSVPDFVDQAEYPDSWYQGEISFSDKIWKIDIKTNTATVVADPIVLGVESIDGIKLMLDENENYLFFVNKKDSFLWELSLK